jgi:hypothetical protein
MRQTKREITIVELRVVLGIVVLVNREPGRIEIDMRV